MFFFVFPQYQRNQGSDVFSGSLAWMLPAEWCSQGVEGGRWWKKPGEKGGKMVV
jgi:hypothetical protein